MTSENVRFKAALFDGGVWVDSLNVGVKIKLQDLKYPDPRF